MAELLALLTVRLRASGQEFVATLVVFCVVGLLFLSGYVALLYALALAIAAKAGPVIAALSVAGVTIGLALIVLLWQNVRRRRLQRIRAMQATSAAMAGTTAAMVGLVPSVIKASPLGSLLAVGILTYFVSRSGYRKAP